MARLPDLSRIRRRLEVARDFFADLAYGARRAARRIGERIGGPIRRLWLRVPLRVRQGAAIVLVVAGVLALLRFAPVPGVPCQVGEAECVPADDAADLVPADALLYLHLNLHEDSSQNRQARELARRLPDPRLVLETVLGTVGTASQKPLVFGRDVRPWLGGEAALASLRGRPELVLAVSNRKEAEAFVQRSLGKVESTQKHRKVEIESHRANLARGEPAASAFVGDFLVIAPAAAVKQAIDLNAGKGNSIVASPGADRVRDLMPEHRVADLFVSRAGVQRLLAGAGGVAAQLETFVDYEATRGFAIAVVAHDDGLELELASVLAPKRAKRAPAFFAAFPPFAPTLDGELDPEALAYLGIAAPARTFSRLLGQASAASPPLARGFQQFRKQLSKEGGLDPQRDLVALLRGEAAITVDPPPPVPHVTLVVEDVDEKKAIIALARLQKPIVGAINPSRNLQAPVFREREIDGVTARSVRLSPTVDLTYAAFDGKLVVSTDPSGVKQVKTGKRGLADTDLYRSTTGQLPAETSAVLFLNLDDLFGLAEQAGLAQDPNYATFRDNIRAVKALALGVRSTKTELDTSIFLTILESK